MNKVFIMIKKEDELAGTVTVENFTLEKYGEKTKRRILDRLLRIDNKVSNKSTKFIFGEKLFMNLPSFSSKTIEEISKHMFSTAYVVCKKEKSSEKVLYLTLLKDTAIEFKNRIPAATKKVKGKTYINPNYFVKEVRLVLA